MPFIRFTVTQVRRQSAVIPKKFHDADTKSKTTKWKPGRVIFYVANDVKTKPKRKRTTKKLVAFR